MPRLGVADPTSRGLTVDADLDTLATALYVRIDDLLKPEPERMPWRPWSGSPQAQRRGAADVVGDASPLGEAATPFVHGGKPNDIVD